MGAFRQIVYLHANSALANEAIRRSALAPMAQGNGSAGPSNLGVTHTTPMNLAISEWELWGDGRKLATEAYRLMQVYRLLSAHGLQESLGTAMQVATLLKRSLHCLQQAGFEAAGLTPKERSVCALARDYCDAMDAQGVIELCQAAPLIKGRIASLDIRMVGQCLLDEPLSGLYGGVLGGCDPSSGSGDSRFVTQDEAHPEFVLLKPQGVSAVLKMVLDETLGALDSGFSGISILDPDVLGSYEALSGPLRSAGAMCALDASVPFSRTSFGSFFLSACKLLALTSCFGIEDRLEPEDVTWIDAATDVALSAYAGIAPFDASALHSLRSHKGARTLRASDLNTLWRADRTLTAEDAVLDLMAVSVGFQRLAVIFSREGDPRASVARFAEEAKRLHGGLGSQMESSAVLSLQSLLDVAISLECPTSYMALFPFGMTLPIRAVDEIADGELDALGHEPSKPLVMFASLDKASCLAPGSFDEVILCDVTDGHLNATEAKRSTDSIALKFGSPVEGMKLERSRQAFYAALAASAVRFACVFPALDEDANESFSSFVLDEFVDVRFEGAISSKDAIGGMSEERLAELPLDAASFMKGLIRSAGEGDFVAGIGCRYDEPTSHVSLPTAERGRLRYLSLGNYLSSADTAGGRLLLISPSAIESYLACPYKWFVEKVIRPRPLDEGFGPLEAGNFAHALLKEFYTKLKEEHGVDRVTALDPDAAWDIFREAADKMYDEQREALPCSGRYLPTTNVEALAFERLVMDVYRSLYAYAALPEAMKVADMELAIGRSASGGPDVAYAGFALTGKVDRVDAGEGCFIVLDYKGGISSYAAGDPTFLIVDSDGRRQMDPQVLPRHVQSLVYAKALLDEGNHGTRCRGALYISYKGASLPKLVAGSYEAGDKGLSPLSGPNSAVFMDMNAFVALVEEAIRDRLAGIYESKIPLEPSYADACRYCCLASCERGKACR